ncbi:MAG TPA: hypothetical protein VK741_06560 [Acetobacteraceae bacterium]|jgi:hypothetical protein|nr:hypothetical protein [Acetobacteraceae bacterium]
MTKTEFHELFLRALNIAADNAEAKLAEQIPRSFVVELHGAGCDGRSVPVDEAVTRIYLGGDRFYRIIDVAVTEILPGKTVVFARVSGHEPASYDHTFDPAGLGPFKQILAEHMVDRRVHSG